MGDILGGSNYCFAKAYVCPVKKIIVSSTSTDGGMCYSVMLRPSSIQVIQKISLKRKQKKMICKANKMKYLQNTSPYAVKIVEVRENFQ